MYTLSVSDQQFVDFRLLVECFFFVVVACWRCWANNLKQWPARSIRGQQITRNYVSILLPVSARERAKSDTVKVSWKTFIDPSKSLAIFQHVSAGRRVPGRFLCGTDIKTATTKHWTIRCCRDLSEYVNCYWYNVPASFHIERARASVWYNAHIRNEFGKTNGFIGPSSLALHVVSAQQLLGTSSISFTEDHQSYTSLM